MIKCIPPVGPLNNIPWKCELKLMPEASEFARPFSLSYLELTPWDLGSSADDLPKTNKFITYCDESL